MEWEINYSWETIKVFSFSLETFNRFLRSRKRSQLEIFHDLTPIFSLTARAWLFNVVSATSLKTLIKTMSKMISGDKFYIWWRFKFCENEDKRRAWITFQPSLFLSVTRREFTSNVVKWQPDTLRSSTSRWKRVQTKDSKRNNENPIGAVLVVVVVLLFHFSNVHKNANSISRIDRWTVLPTHLWFVKPFSQWIHSKFEYLGELD